MYPRRLGLLLEPRAHFGRTEVKSRRSRFKKKKKVSGSDIETGVGGWKNHCWRKRKSCFLMDLKSLHTPPSNKLAWIGQLNPHIPRWCLHRSDRTFNVLQCYTTWQHCTTWCSMLTSQNISEKHSLTKKTTTNYCKNNLFWADGRQWKFTQSYTHTHMLKHTHTRVCS